MATRSVREHPDRFLVAILEAFIDKVLSEKTTVATQAKTVYIWPSVRREDMVLHHLAIWPW